MTKYTISGAMFLPLVPPTHPATASPQRSAGAWTQRQTSRSQHGKPIRSCVSADMKLRLHVAVRTLPCRCGPETMYSRELSAMKLRTCGTRNKPPTSKTSQANSSAYPASTSQAEVMAHHGHGLEPVWRQDVRMEEAVVFRDET